MKVATGSVVELDYKLHLGDGQIIDQSEPGEPLAYLHGRGQIVPGLERALEGMGVGDSKKVTVDSKDGYGAHDPRGVQEVARSAFPPGVNISAGMQFVTTDDAGEQIPITVKEVKQDGAIVIDLNHPLAGKDLHFEVTVRGVRAATAEELEHGHAHGPEGHGHE